MRTLLVFVVMFVVGGAAQAETPRRVTLLHTNDWQSGLTGVGPDAAYTDDVVGDDQTRGGVSRLATLIDRLRAKRSAEGPVFLLDGGDITMGTLHHTVTRETGSELRLMAQLGYDAVTLGNHEFDFRPQGLGQMIASATTATTSLPPIIATNLDLTSQHPDLAVLERLYRLDVLHRSRIIERGGLKVGFVGILGVDAQEVMEGDSPVRILPPAATAQQTAVTLRDQGADLVVALSHSGVREDAEGRYQGEEVDLLRAAPAVDVVIGGHSHTALRTPILVDDRPIVQAGSDTHWLGELVLDETPTGWKVAHYALHPIDDTLVGREDIRTVVEAVEREVDARILQPLGYRFDQVVAEVDGHHGRGFDEHVIGNLVTDSMRIAAGAQISATGNGTLRSDLYPGLQRVPDIFRISGLGVGDQEDTPGYPLVKCWMNGPSLKAVLEFLLIGYTLKGSDYYPRLSGVRVHYNPLRVPFDRITAVEVGSDEAGFAPVDLTDVDLRISMATTNYVAKFLPQVSELSFGLLNVEILDAAGRPVAMEALSRVVVDVDPETPGVQELKAWRALVDHVARMPDTDGDGVPNIPVTGPAAALRLLPEPSLSPSSLWGNATWIMWSCTAIFALTLLLVVAVVRRLLRRGARRAVEST